MEPLIEIAEEAGQPIMGVLDRYYVGEKFEGLDVFGSDLDLINPENTDIQELIEFADFFVVTYFGGVTNVEVLSENTFHLRQERIALVKEAGCNLTNLLHPGSDISPTARIGRNTLVLKHAYIESHARIGSFCQFMYNNGIAHHSIIGDNCTFLPGTTGCAGKTVVGNNVVVGMETHIMSSGDTPTVIGDNVILGPRLMILKDVPSNSIVQVNGKILPNKHFTTDVYQGADVLSGYKRIRLDKENI